MSEARRVSAGLSRIMEIVDENSSSLPEGAYLEIGRLLVGEHKVENGERVLPAPAHWGVMQKINMLSDIFKCKSTLVQIQKNHPSVGDNTELSFQLNTILMRSMTGDYNWMPVEIKRSIDTIATMTEGQLYHHVSRHIDPNNLHAVYIYGLYLHHLDIICKYMPSA